ncbi:agmatinase family protein [Sphingomonas profundi]|uniref:agmatinase family protein n=1 Tax=Alterirhizorhabdus profundi TaxID=2681549 RepID=UPI0012E90EDB|nr:agmatinase family protein [Sphingomonas profundi]
MIAFPRIPALRGAALAMALAAGIAPAAVQVALTPAQQAFVDDPAMLQRFGLTRDRLMTILSRQDAAAAQATVASMMQTIEAAKFQPGDPAVAADPVQPLDPVEDMAAVPLNPQAGDYNASTVLRPATLDEYQRDPGPFSLKRYLYEQDPIPTFAGAPVALRAEDLTAGKVDVAFVGVPLDLGSGWRDSQNAPATLRAMYGSSGYDVYAGVDPTVQLSIADYGDLSVDKMSAEVTVEHVRKMIGEMLGTGVIPFIVGGDHALMFPTVAAMTDRYGVGKVGVVQLDAHFDAMKGDGHFISDQQAVSRLIEAKLIQGRDIVQVGTRGQEMSGEDMGWMRTQGLRYHTMAEVESRGWDKVLASVLDEVRGGPENIFVSFDVSVLDPAFASGAGRPAPGGLTMREAVPMVRRICAETKVVGFEMLDVAPYLDLSYATALNANYIMHACLTGIAMRKGGIKDPAYLSPLTVSSATATGAKRR